jgi:hypothetical protein
VSGDGAREREGGRCARRTSERSTKCGGRHIFQPPSFSSIFLPKMFKFCAAASLLLAAAAAVDPELSAPGSRFDVQFNGDSASFKLYAKPGPRGARFWNVAYMGMYEVDSNGNKINSRSVSPLNVGQNAQVRTNCPSAKTPRSSARGARCTHSRRMRKPS